MIVRDIATLLTRDPEIRHGRPCIRDTGITVHRIAIWYQLENSAEDIAHQYPHLDLAGIYAAIAFYQANRSEIDAEIAADAADAA